MFDAFTLWQLLSVGVIGLIAGTLGGMLGVGGSIVIIPALVVLLGRPSGVEQHLYQAAAMTANVFVSIPAALRHRRAGMLVPSLLRWMIPASLLAVVAGVFISNLPLFSGRDGALWLGRLLAVFLLYVAVLNVWRVLRPREAIAVPLSTQTPTPGETTVHVRPGAATLIGTLMGLIAGLLGIGGGTVAVPLQQTLLRLPLRNCIANSSLIICISASLGAIYKNATLSQHQPPPELAALALTSHYSWTTGLTLGLLLAPTAFLGGRLGAALTHRLPLPTIRIAFVALMLVASWKMAALGQ